MVYRLLPNPGSAWRSDFLQRFLGTRISKFGDLSADFTLLTPRSVGVMLFESVDDVLPICNPDTAALKVRGICRLWGEFGVDYSLCVMAQ